jgi:hypothetical protein
VLCAITARQLKTGSYDDFRKAWQPEGELPPKFVRILQMRNVRDENEVISCGFFDGTLEELRQLQQDLDYGGQRERTGPFVVSFGTDGIFEVIEEITPESAAAGGSST